MELEHLPDAGEKGTTAKLTPEQFLDLGREILARGFSLRFRVSGQSMWPSLRSGDVITVKSATADGVRPGDIALYSRDGKPIVHRVLKRRNIDGVSVFLARGDSGDGKYEVVGPGMISGKVVSVTHGDVERAVGRPWDRATGVALSELGLLARRACGLARRLVRRH